MRESKSSKPLKTDNVSNNAAAPTDTPKMEIPEITFIAVAELLLNK
jgi:hypothetical protein